MTASPEKLLPAQGTDSRDVDSPVAARGRRSLTLTVAAGLVVSLSAASAWWLRGHLARSTLPAPSKSPGPAAPDDGAANDLAKRGRVVYQVYCVQCHGPEGHGDGDSAAELDPPPRDFAQGPWKFGTGAAAIRKVIVAGIPGTTMPASPALAPAELDALVAYVRTLTPELRGPEPMPAVTVERLRAAGFTAASSLCPAPPLELRDLDGRRQKLDELRGKLVLVHFWGTTCVHCREALPALERLAEAYQGRGLAVLSVCADESDSGVVSRLGRQHVRRLPLYVSPDGQARVRYDVQLLPSYFLIDPRGRLLGQAHGEKAWSDSAIEALLRTWVPARPGAEVGPLIGRIKAVGPEGKGNEEAARAWRELIRSGPEVLPTVLAALDDADAPAAHWLRAAIDQIAEQALAARRPLPTKELEAFVLEKRHASRARYLAYEWLARADSTAPARLLPRLLDDPGPELRREAVAAVVEKAEKELAKDDRAAARATFRRALTAARDPDQVRQVAGRLERLGEKVDLAAHFGFVQQWLLLGPFDNTAGKGFQAALAPEKRPDPDTVYEGKAGRKLRWRTEQTADAFGVVDLNRALGKEKEAVAYALAVVVVDKERPVEVRAGSNNAIQIFLNGERVFARAIAHQGMRMDQHVGRGILKAGRNQVLVKIGQDEALRAGGQQWSFQLRLCDALGGALPVKVVELKAGAGDKGGQP
jgi:mono/diheme cytochrome c family protein/peroxiredoxin